MNGNSTVLRTSDAPRPLAAQACRDRETGYTMFRMDEATLKPLSPVRHTETNGSTPAWRPLECRVATHSGPFHDPTREHSHHNSSRGGPRLQTVNMPRSPRALRTDKDASLVDETQVSFGAKASIPGKIGNTLSPSLPGPHHDRAPPSDQLDDDAGASLTAKPASSRVSSWRASSE
jgi:hypothetical protein